MDSYIPSLLEKVQLIPILSKSFYWSADKDHANNNST